jgi:hypothetical protein
MDDCTRLSVSILKPMGFRLTQTQRSLTQWPFAVLFVLAMLDCGGGRR